MCPGIQTPVLIIVEQGLSTTGPSFWPRVLCSFFVKQGASSTWLLGLQRLNAVFIADTFIAFYEAMDSLIPTTQGDQYTLLLKSGFHSLALHHCTHEPRMVGHTFHSNTWETEAEEWAVVGHPGLHSGLAAYLVPFLLMCLLALDQHSKRINTERDLMKWTICVKQA